MQGLLVQFARHAGLWQAAVKAMAELDALMSLAYAAQFAGDGAPMCRPNFVEPDAASPSASHVSTLLLACQRLTISCCACKAYLYSMRMSTSAGGQALSK